MKVNIEIERSAVVPVPYKQVEPLLTDLEGTIGRFPKLKKLTRLGPDRYLWEMRTIGSRIANIAHDVSYGAHYHLDLPKGELSWKPVANQGNATIEGFFRLTDSGEQTRLTFRVWGELRDVPVPLLYRVVAPPFIQGKFTRLVDTFLEETRDALVNGKAGKPKAAKKRNASA
jgi:carbon monoxide dehydrogenase subunit G